MQYSQRKFGSVVKHHAPPEAKLSGLRQKFSAIDGFLQYREKQKKKSLSVLFVLNCRTKLKLFIEGDNVSERAG